MLNALTNVRFWGHGVPVVPVPNGGLATFHQSFRLSVGRCEPLPTPDSGPSPCYGVCRFGLSWGGKASMDFKKFYFSPEGRINRQQFWLWLILPLTAIEILLVAVDVMTGNYNQKLGIGVLSGIFALASLIPA